jgi:hypothetical protein
MEDLPRPLKLKIFFFLMLLGAIYGGVIGAGIALLTGNNAWAGDWAWAVAKAVAGTGALTWAVAVAWVGAWVLFLAVALTVAGVFLEYLPYCMDFFFANGNISFVIWQSVFC